jgi:putative sterol carrier protein
MGTPADIDTQINAAIAGRTEVEGKMQFADDLDPMLKYAANAEVRRRDTQASYTKTQQENIALVSENGQLANTWAEEVSKHLTAEQQAELEELKHTDQEAWREKINMYEGQNASRVKEKHTKIKAKASEETSLQQRERVLKEHNEANPKFALTDDVIDNDIPPRITKKLEEGKISFEEFLTEAHAFLSAGKVIDPGEEAPGGVDLSKAGGDHKPSAKAVEGSMKESYTKEIY